jgi:ubiquinone/menaquinone biosynthesis C-methylase UbiE
LNRYYNKLISFGFIFTFTFVLVFIIPSAGQHKEGVLEPENYNEARLNRLQPPAKVMDAIGIEPGMTVAEIGAGRGRYVVHLAVRVGDKGKVFAEDINALSLDHLKKRCQRWGLNHVQTILGEVTNAKLPKDQLDLIFIISSYHHFSDPVELLRKARPSLKKTGRLVICEWMPKNKKNNPYNTPQQMEDEMRAAGYTLDRIDRLLEKNRMLIYIFRPNNS